jgi:putative spermidine/putrescine transport system substrate-binding protein
MQIADAALYLSKASPQLRIVDPYELTSKQLAAAVTLLRRQRPLLAGYWDYAADEVQLFKNGRAVVGAGWPWQAATLRAANVPVLEADPREGMTGWTDSWMIAAQTAHPNCAYRWLQYTSTPTVQATIAKSYGAAPVSAAACTVMEQKWPGSCKALHGDATPAYFRSIRFWKTPLDACADGTTHCTDSTAWQRAWTQVAG